MENEENKRHAISLYINDAMYKRLKEFIDESGLNQMGVIREAIDAYLRSKGK